MDNRYANTDDFSTEVKNEGFKVYKFEGQDNVRQSYSRKDFYKISLVSGKGWVHYSDKLVEVNGASLILGEPCNTFTWKICSKGEPTYTCVFTKGFLRGDKGFDCLWESQSFSHWKTPVFSLTPEKKKFVATIFGKMICEQCTLYTFRDELIRSHINLLIHEALKATSLPSLRKQKSSHPIPATQFIELFERQFPIEGQIIISN